jgi:hypothetical protein
VDVSTTSDPLSGGRRVTHTAPGEFLEFSIEVAQSGLYDFEARVASPDLGASFRLDIDQRTILPVVSIPDTNGEDNMVTVSAGSNVFLTSGPHILRLNIETGTGVNNNFAGSYNFITVRPATTGTFQLTVPNANVIAGARTQLSLSWTVPSGGWRGLEHVDLRLRNESGRLLWIRFDEATNTMRMYRESNGKFGPAREVGSNRVLRGPLANVFMKTTTVVAAGPTSPTVEITFDLMFKGRARGRWVIEAAASDDFGHEDPFRFAGMLEVH